MTTALAARMTRPSPKATDYERIEAAIHFLDENSAEQPPLAEVAAEIGLSEAHFQRLFQRWAGVSPKRFLQYLTADHARRLLRDSASVLDAADEVGLSGGGRLHDLTVSVLAMTPGEIQRLADGLEIRYGFHDTPFGRCVVALTERGICNLSFLDTDAEGERLLRAEWPLATLRRDDEATAATVERAFAFTAQPARGPYTQPLAVHVRGTNFQVRVWEALVRIPVGRVATYGSLASDLGLHGAARAVGGSVAHNPVAFLIPCHRVIRSTGAFGEYRWGSVRKKVMLAREAALR